MPQRVNEFNKKVIYTDTNPEGIVSAKKNSLFFRKGTEFFVNYSGNLDGKWEKLPYTTVIIPPPSSTKLIIYKEPQELWIKAIDGYYNEFNELMPKTGWKFISYQDIFANANPRTLKWIFPVPTSTYDPIGNSNSRSYDENYFYAKINGFWYRTPLTTFTSTETEGSDRIDLSNNLPFVDYPRHRPVPSNPNSESTLINGEQSYDKDYFYVKVSKWKRTRLNIYYNTNKMARF